MDDTIGAMRRWRQPVSHAQAALNLSCEQETQLIALLRDAPNDFGKKLLGLAHFRALC
jgi:hypothetical protein